MRSDVLVNRATARHRRAGPIRQHIEAFAAQATGLGYARSTIEEHVRLLRRLDQWMERRHLSAVDLDARVMGAFLAGPRSRRHTRRHGGASLLGRFLQYLQAVGATPAPPPVIDPSPRSHLERTYREYLQAQCGLCVTTIETYVGVFRRFVTECLSEACSVGTLTASDVSA